LIARIAEGPLSATADESAQARPPRAICRAVENKPMPRCHHVGAPRMVGEPMSSNSGWRDSARPTLCRTPDDCRRSRSYVSPTKHAMSAPRHFAARFRPRRCSSGTERFEHLEHLLYISIAYLSMFEGVQ